MTIDEAKQELGLIQRDLYVKLTRICRECSDIKDIQIDVSIVDEKIVSTADVVYRRDVYPQISISIGV